MRQAPVSGRGNDSHRGARDHPALTEEQPSVFSAHERRIAKIARRAPTEFMAYME